jgi:hypothetical protein
VSDNTELYYAEMEAARNESEDKYFKARPQLETLMSRQLFQAGFERAYRLLWMPTPPDPAGEGQ